MGNLSSPNIWSFFPNEKGVHFNDVIAGVHDINHQFVSLTGIVTELHFSNIHLPMRTNVSDLLDATMAIKFTTTMDVQIRLLHWESLTQNMW